MNFLEKFHSDLKSAFTKHWKAGIFEQTFTPQFDMTDGFVSGNALVYHFEEDLAMQDLLVLTKWCQKRQVTFTIASYSNEIRFFVSNYQPT